MKAIYEPAGAAREYAELAVNLFRGCGNGCTYCYGPGCLRMKAEEFHAGCRPRPGIVEAIQRDARRMAERGDRREVLLCFTCDPFPGHRACGHDDTANKTTIAALATLVEHGIHCTTLTKNPNVGLRAVLPSVASAVACDLADLGCTYRFGVSLSWLDDAAAAAWEPRAETPTERRLALGRAHAEGLRTWLSVEPVIDPTEALAVLEHAAPHVDEVRVGRWNHDKRARGIDWPAFARAVADRFAELRAGGVRCAMKEGLLDALGPDAGVAEMDRTRTWDLEAAAAAKETL